MTEIHIMIDAQGNAVIDVLGAKGKQCATLVKPLVESIGEIVTEKKKPSFYQESHRAQKLRLLL